MTRRRRRGRRCGDRRRAQRGASASRPRSRRSPARSRGADLGRRRRLARRHRRDRARRRARASCAAHGAIGKGAAVTRAARDALRGHAPRTPGRARRAEAVFLLCDGDLGDSRRASSRALVDAVARGEADVAVAIFAARARRRLRAGARLRALGDPRRAAGLRTRAPISGQRALSAARARGVLPFADGFGMEIGDDDRRRARRALRVRRDRARPRAIAPAGARPPASPTARASSSTSCASTARRAVEPSRSGRRA